MGSTARIAMVLTDDDHDLTVEAWSAALEQLGVSMTAPVQRSDKGAITVELEGGMRLGAIFIPKPVPGGELDSHTRPSPYWPDAADQIPQHSAHLLVTLLGEAEVEFMALMPLTAATLAAAHVLEAPGIYWGMVPQVTRTDIAMQVFLQAMQDEDIPVGLWVAVDLSRLADGRFAGLTRGLDAFEHPELWVTSSEMDPGALWGTAMSLTSYIIGQGMKLEAGQALRTTEEEHIKIVAAPHPGGLEQIVLRIDYP